MPDPVRLSDEMRRYAASVQFSVMLRTPHQREYCPTCQEVRLFWWNTLVKKWECGACQDWTHFATGKEIP